MRPHTDGSGTSSSSRRAYIKTIGGTVLAATVAGCNQGSDGDTPTETDPGETPTEAATEGATATPSPSTLSYPPPNSGASGLLLEVIKDEGFDQEENLSMDYQYASVPAGEQLLINNETETGHLGTLGNVRANDEGADIRQLWPLMRNNESLVVNPEVDVPTDGSVADVMEAIEDLTIASLGESSVVYTIFGVIAAEAGHLDTFQNIDFRFGAPASIRGLAQEGEVDAMANFAPHTTALIAEHDFEKAIDYPAAWNELTGTSISQNGVCAHQSVIEEKPEALRRFQNAYFAASEYVQNNIEDVFQEYQDHLDVTDEVMPVLVENARETEWFPRDFDGSIREGEIQFTNLAYEHGFLEVEPNTDELFVGYDEL